MSKFKEEETTKLVELYVEHECLWNLTSIHYRNRNMRQAAEKEIIEKMEITGFGLAELKQKIKNLRCTYNQECTKIKKSIKSGAGAEDIYVPNIKWFSAFNEIMKRAKAGKKTDCSLETTIIQNTNSFDENQENEEEGTVHELHSPDEGQSSKAVPKTPVSDKPPAKRNKLDNLTKAVVQLHEASQVIHDTSSNSSNNEHEAFGNFIAATLNSLPKRKALIAQYEIQGILLKYRLAETEPPKSFTYGNVMVPPTPQYSGRDSYDNHFVQSPYSNSCASCSNSVVYGAADLVYSPESTDAQSESNIS